MNGTPLRFAAPLALLLGLFTVAGCAGADRYGRYGGYGGYGRTGEYGRGGYNYPSSARVGGSGRNARYRVCHRGDTKVLPAPAAVGGREAPHVPFESIESKREVAAASPGRHAAISEARVGSRAGRRRCTRARARRARARRRSR